MKDPKRHSASASRSLLRFDWAAKTVLREKENHDILEGLLGVLFGEEVRIVELLESESNAVGGNDKFNRVDIKAKNAQGDIILVEIQLTRELHYMQRILYATSKTLAEHIKRGEEYDNVRKVYSVNILYFDLGTGSDYLYRGGTEFIGVHTHDRLIVSRKYRKISQRVDPSKLFPEYYLLRVNAYSGEPHSHLEEWMRYLKDGIVDEGTEAPGLKEAYARLQYCALPEKARKAYDAYLYDMHYQQDVIAAYDQAGWERGREEGEKKGREEGEAIGLEKGEAIGLEKGEAIGRKAKALAIARQMKQMGLSDAQILQATGLTADELEAVWAGSES